MTHKDGEHQVYQEESYRDDEIDLAELFRVIWRKKILIVLSTVVFACVSYFIAAYLLASPPVSTVSQDFSLKFAGIEENKYPNGLRFSLAEITAPPIIKKVYVNNKLSDFGLELNDLRDSLLVRKSVDGLIGLEQKYNPLFDRKGLTPEERQLLQDEYDKHRAKLFETPYYTITWVEQMGTVPLVVQEKVLHEILMLWARNAEEHKGVYIYQVPIMADDAFYFENIDNEYIVNLDILRNLASALNINVNEIYTLPGALLAKTSSGSTITSLKLRANGLFKYYISPLTGIIRSGGLHVNFELAVIYIRERIYSLEMTKGALLGEIALLKDAVDGYINSDDQLMMRRQGGQNRSSQNFPGTGNTVIPQIGDRFLDQLVSLANENQDVAYRQEKTSQMVAVGKQLLGVNKDIAYYQRLLKSIEENKDNKNQSLLSAFESKNKIAIVEAKYITKEMTEIYHTISESYLKVSEKLYQLEGPIQLDESRAVSLKKVVLVYSVSLVVFFCLMCFMVMLGSALTKRSDD